MIKGHWGKCLNAWCEGGTRINYKVDIATTLFVIDVSVSGQAALEP